MPRKPGVIVQTNPSGDMPSGWLRREIELAHREVVNLEWWRSLSLDKRDEIRKQNGG